jgi:PEGA domain
MQMKKHFNPVYAGTIIALILCAPLYAGNNQVMGEIHLEGKTKVEKTSGVWVDGQYVGYLKELKGSKKVLLLPGEHTISIRQNGYQDFTQGVMVKPGAKQTIQVEMQKAANGPMPKQWAVVKLDVFPDRAAVFLDGQFVGHVGEFQGLGHSLEVAPGNHKIRITLPGYTPFETEISPLAKQKVEVKTQLLKSNAPLADPSLGGHRGDNGPPPPPDNAPPPPPDTAPPPPPPPPQ